MTHYINSFLGLLLLTNLAFAANNNSSYWQCTTRDEHNWVWTAKSNFKKTSTNLAYAACKKHSQSPKTCNTTADNCDYINKGLSTRPLWRCTAVDLTAMSWKSAYYRQRLDAAMGAQQFCHHKSSVPSTCYVNTVTCSNLNEAN